MMREVVKSARHEKAFNNDGHDRAGKTGTTNECVDACFVGFDADHTTAVWVGSDAPKAWAQGNRRCHVAARVDEDHGQHRVAGTARIAIRTRPSSST